MDDEVEPAPLDVERAQRSAKKAETKERVPSAAKAGHMAVWAGAKAKAVKKIDSEESDDKGVQARMGADRTVKTLAMTTQFIKQSPDSSLARSAGTNDRAVRYRKLRLKFFSLIQCLQPRRLKNLHVLSSICFR